MFDLGLVVVLLDQCRWSQQRSLASWLIQSSFVQQLLRHWVESGGVWAPIIYVASVAVMNATWVPRWLTSLVGGALFGILYGAGLALVGSLLAA